MSFIYTVTILIRNADIVGPCHCILFCLKVSLIPTAKFSQGQIICTFFSFLLIYGGLGVGVLGLGFWIVFLGWGFQWMGHPNSSIDLIMLPTILQAANLELRLGHWQSLNLVLHSWCAIIQYPKSIFKYTFNSDFEYPLK